MDYNHLYDLGRDELTERAALQEISAATALPSR